MVLVTGTDTGCGKTVLSALLVSALDAVYEACTTGALEGTDRESRALVGGGSEDRSFPEKYLLIRLSHRTLPRVLAGVRH